MKTITVIAEDKLGLLADISYILAKSSININNLNAELLGKKAIITMHVSDQQKAMEALTKSGYKTAEAEAIVVKIPNRIGAIEKITERLAANGINIENVSMLSCNQSDGVFAFRVDRPKKAGEVLVDVMVRF